MFQLTSDMYLNVFIGFHWTVEMIVQDWLEIPRLQIRALNMQQQGNLTAVLSKLLH